MFKIGHGYDVHCLVNSRPLILAGVPISHNKGLQGHSDADVLTHSVMDALLGAASLGDIGKIFPDTDPAYKDAHSLDLLKIVINMLEKLNYSISNLDCTIIAQSPRLSQYIAKMRQNLADCCNISIEDVSIKATTEEGLGFSGAEEGIAAHCVCLISKGSNQLYSNDFLNLEVEILKKREQAIIPKRATEGSAGLDIHACIEDSVTILPGESIKIPTGIAISVKNIQNKPSLAAFLFARSGLAIKHGITLSNSVGVIDSDYRGEIVVGLRNLGKEAYTINPGARIAQLIFMPVFTAKFIESMILPQSLRGENGLGSSGE